MKRVQGIVLLAVSLLLLPVAASADSYLSYLYITDTLPSGGFNVTWGGPELTSFVLNGTSQALTGSVDFSQGSAITFSGSWDDGAFVGGTSGTFDLIDPDDPGNVEDILTFATSSATNPIGTFTGSFTSETTEGSLGPNEGSSSLLGLTGVGFGAAGFQEFTYGVQSSDESSGGPVPEPSSLLLLGSSLSGLAAVLRRKRA